MGGSFITCHKTDLPAILRLGVDNRYLILGAVIKVVIVQAQSAPAATDGLPQRPDRACLLFGYRLIGAGPSACAVD